MNKIKLVLLSSLAGLGALAPVFVAKADEAAAYTALENAVASGTASAMSGITDNLPAIIGVGVLIVVIFLVWRIFKRFAGGR